MALKRIMYEAHTHMHMHTQHNTHTHTHTHTHMHTHFYCDVSPRAMQRMEDSGFEEGQMADTHVFQVTWVNSPTMFLISLSLCQPETIVLLCVAK